MNSRSDQGSEPNRDPHRDPLWFTDIGYKFDPMTGKFEPVNPEAAAAFADDLAELLEDMRRMEAEMDRQA